MASPKFALGQIVATPGALGPLRSRVHHRKLVLALVVFVELSPVA